MKWFIRAMEDEYGKDNWERMSEYDQLTSMAAFGETLKGAIIFINKFRKNNNHGMG